ncbi:MAG: amidase family protein [Cyanobacteria bacterium P01_H01_bin.58]
MPQPQVSELQISVLRIAVTAITTAALSPLFVAEKTLSATFTLEEATIGDINKAFDSGALTAESLTQLYLNRIEAYDDTLNSLIAVNPNALSIAEALDIERQTIGPRSPLHGIPVILKDNFDTFDMPTTAGSLALEGSIPPDDAFIVQKLRDAGAIILAKANMDELAHGGSPGGGYSSLGGQTLNPYNFNRGPSGSSSGSAAAIAANLGVIGLGSDTLGSIRGPSMDNSLVGLRPTLGLTSRDGIIPFSSSFDTGGPFARTVEDLAITLSYITGVDPNDPATAASEGQFPADYTAFLEENAFEGVRIGFLGGIPTGNPDLDAGFAQAIATIESLGATIAAPIIPPIAELIPFFGPTGVFTTVSQTELKAELADYLATTDPEYPKTLAEVIAISESPEVLNSEFPVNPTVLGRWQSAEARGSLSDPEYMAAISLLAEVIAPSTEAILTANNIDALVYITSSCTATPLPGVDDPTFICSEDAIGLSALATAAGLPDVQVPAGFASDGLPYTLSFLGLPYSEPELLGFAYAFEQATKARKPPEFFAALPGETIEHSAIPEPTSVAALIGVGSVVAGSKFIKRRRFEQPVKDSKRSSSRLLGSL